jgi:predicted amidophosphoribosyltransferase
MEKQVAHYQQYYGALAIQVYAPAFYYGRSQKPDYYSKQIVDGKHQDLSAYFLDGIKSVFEKLPFKPNLIVVAPSSKKGNFSPTLDSLAKRLQKDYGIPYANVVERIREGKKLTTCAHLDERYREVKDAFKVNLNMKGLKVIILDDTKTTGLTTLECSKALRAAGAIDVLAVCLGINKHEA